MNAPRFEPTPDQGRWLIVDRRLGGFVENRNGNARRFYSLGAADRFAAALNRGVRRPVGTRA